MKLNIGCGFECKPDYINIDSDPRVRPDIIRNIERGLPFSDNTCEEIFCKHIMEHISPDLIHFIMREFYRVLIPNGRLKIIVPIGKGLTNSPEHKSFWDYKSYLFFTEWNLREPYKFNLIKQEVVGSDIGEELHFELEVTK